MDQRHRNALIWQRFATSRFGSNENIFPVCQSFETFTWLTVSASKLNLSQISFYDFNQIELRYGTIVFICDLQSIASKRNQYTC
jgi:hypothetical protein